MQNTVECLNPYSGSGIFAGMTRYRILVLYRPTATCFALAKALVR